MITILFLLSLYVVLVCFVPLFIRYLAGKFDFLEPVFAAVVTMVSLFAIRPLLMILEGELDYYRWVHIGDTLPGALLIAAVGVTSYMVGYYLIPVHSRTPQVDQQVIVYRRMRLVMICLAYVFVGLILAWIYVGSNPIGALLILSLGRSQDAADIVTVRSEYLFAAPVLIACAAIIIVAIKGRTRLTVSMYFALIVLILLPVIWFYFVGVRRFIIPSVFIPMLVFLLARQIKLSARHFVILVPIFVILAALPFMRTQGARDQIGGIVDQVVWAFTREDILQDIFLGPDTAMLPVFTVEVQALDSLEKFSFGAATIGDLMLAPWPSALVAKPMSARNKMLVEAFGRPCSANPGGLCPDFSVVGSFYQDFSVIGVILGMTLMGYVGRRVWYQYKQEPWCPRRIFNVASVSVFTLIIIRAGFMPAFQWFLYFWVPVSIGLRLIVFRSIPDKPSDYWDGSKIEQV